jgi:hypothetical protein
MRRRMLVVAAALALAGSAARAEEPGVAVTGVDFRAAHIHVEARYRGADAPEFRVVPACGASIASDWTVPATTRTATGDVSIDLARDFTWLLDGGTRPPCRVTGLVLQMLDGPTVVAAAHVPVAVRDGAGPEVPAAKEPPAAPSRLRLSGQKTEVKPASRTEAGMLWALNDHLSLQLNFARTSMPPTRPQDHEDGFLTRLRLGF